MTDNPKTEFNVDDLSEYTCEHCEETFLQSRSEKERIAERNELFPYLNEEDQCVVCEPCFIKIMDYNEPNQKRYKKFVGE